MLNTAIIKKTKKVPSTDSAAKDDLVGIDLMGAKKMHEKSESPKKEMEETMEEVPKQAVKTISKPKAEDLASIDLAMSKAKKVPSTEKAGSDKELETIESANKDGNSKIKYLNKLKALKGM